MSDLKINRPEPIVSVVEMEFFDQSSNIQHTISNLEKGRSVLITGLYSNGLTLLEELHTHLRKKLPNKTYQEQRAYRARYRILSNLIFIEIVDHKLAVNKAPIVGWLKKLYPEIEHFLLPFPKVQGLNSSWQWYENGITIPGLRNKIHPYYGTYFPTRFEHLELFDNWLKRYKGAKKSAIDLGTGCGVMALQMVQYGFQKVYGTDTNPNAIVGLKEFMGETKLSRKIEVDHGHMFGKWNKETELIVFNPPWLPKSRDLDQIDEAIYYNETLFTEFFTEAKKRLLPDGKIVLLFSNLAQITNVTTEHPIEKEINEGGRFQLERTFKKKIKTAPKKSIREQPWRSTEEVELWVLVHKENKDN
ncbi:MAG: methyltransferase [Salinivirgaceae bacterium]|nr:methyltransferase [Salinivirgaceae bacterium]